MPLTVNVISELYCVTSAEIELPFDSWSEVKDWYVKWDCLHYTLDGENWSEIRLESSSDHDAIDWKRPVHVEIQSEDMQEVIDEK